MLDSQIKKSKRDFVPNFQLNFTKFKDYYITLPYCSDINEYITQLFIDTPHQNSIDVEKCVKVEKPFLSQIAAGILENISAEEFILAIKNHYPKMDKNRKLACLFFINEFINKNITKDWEQSNFEAEFFTFLDAFKEPYIEIRKILLRNYDNKIGKFSTDYIIEQEEKEQSFWIERFVYDINMYTCSLYLAFTPKDILFENLNKANSPAAKLTDFVNNLTRMVSWDIVTTKNQTKRADKLKLYLKTIERFIRNEGGSINLCAAYCLFNGINATPVSRLEETWKKLYKKSSHARDLFTEFSNLFKFESGFKSLRNFIQEHPDNIPPLFMLVFDKQRTSEFKSLHLKFSNNGGLNDNFIRMQERLRLWHFKLPYQTNFQIVLLKASNDENELDKLSKSIEPPPEAQIKKISKGMANLKINAEKVESSTPVVNSNAPVTRLKRSNSDISLLNNENTQEKVEAKTKAKDKNKRRSITVIAMHEEEHNSNTSNTFLPMRESKKGKPKSNTYVNIDMEIDESPNQKGKLKNNVNNSFL